MKVETDKLGFGRLMLWQSRAISQAGNLMVLSYLTIYCTNILGLNPGLMGMLLLVSRLFDGITDIVAGYIVDRTNTKWGRGRPYEWCIVGMWICTYLMFSAPTQASIVLKSVWVLVMYAFVNSIFATFLNASNTPYVVRAFNNQKHYVSITAYGGLSTMLAVILINISFPIAMSKLATSAVGWQKMIAIYAIPMVLIGILRFFFIKEVHNVDVITDKINFKHVITVLKTNRFIYTAALIQFVLQLVGAMGVGVFYYTYVVKNVALMGLVSITTLIVLPSMAILPALLKKFTKKQLIIAGFVISCIGSVLNWFAVDNILILVIAGLLTGMGVIPANMLSGLMVIDCAEYNEWKQQPRMEGTLGVIPGFANKIGAAFGAFLLGVFLQIGGYISSDIAVQPDSAIIMLRLLISFIPLAFYALAIGVTTLYKLDDKIVQIRKDNEERRAAVIEQNT